MLQSHEQYFDLTLFIPGFLAGVERRRREDVFHLYPVTHLSLKSDNSNFVQNYFEVTSIFFGHYDVTITSSLFWWVSKTTKHSLLLDHCCFFESYWNLAEIINTYIASHSKSQIYQ